VDAAVLADDGADKGTSLRQVLPRENNWRRLAGILSKK